MQMKVTNQEEYDKYKEGNKDGFGAAIFRYAERWALMMESEMSKGAKVVDVAEKTSNKADTEGISGAMYACAVNFLCNTWAHGDKLKAWHNGKYDYEGDGVVNPSVIVVKN